MSTERETQQRIDQFAEMLRLVANGLGSGVLSDPTQADAAVSKLNSYLEAWHASENRATPPPDLGLGQLAGIGPDAARELGDTRIPHGVKPYDDEVSPSRITATGD